MRIKREDAKGREGNAKKTAGEVPEDCSSRTLRSELRVFALSPIAAFLLRASASKLAAYGVIAYARFIPMKSTPALLRIFALALAVVGFVAVSLAASTKSNDSEIRRDLKLLESALQASDPTAWVYCYTEDAMFVGPGEAPVQGRAALLEMAKSMTPLRNLQLVPQRIESSGALAYAYIRGHWSNGQPGAPLTRVRSLLVLRREADGHWRVAQELMHGDPAPLEAEPESRAKS